MGNLATTRIVLKAVDRKGLLLFWIWGDSGVFGGIAFQIRLFPLKRQGYGGKHEG